MHVYYMALFNPPPPQTNKKPQFLPHGLGSGFLSHLLCSKEENVVKSTHVHYVDILAPP